MKFDIYNLYVVGGAIGAWVALMGTIYGSIWLINKWPVLGKFFAALPVLFILTMCTAPIADSLREDAARTQSNDGKPNE